MESSNSPDQTHMNIQLFNGGRAPSRKHSDDAGLDCYSNEDTYIEAGETRKVALGFGIELPNGFEMQIPGRSGVSLKGILCHLGTVDAGYRGEVSCILTNLTKHAFAIGKGDRIAQAVISRYIYVALHVEDTLNASERGSNGFGSTGV